MLSLLAGVALLFTGPTSIEKEVVFKGAGGLELKGTLALPAHSKGKTGAILLLPGSGPTDRNGNQVPVFMTDLLKQISQNLNEQGFATLRFDKRASAPYRPIFLKMTVDGMAEFFKWDNFVGDATAALHFLQKQSTVDPHKVGILGHSEGALLALQIGKNEVGKADVPAVLITMGGTGRPMGPILHEQIARALDKQKQVDPVRAMYLNAVDKATAQVAKTATFPKDLPPGLQSLFNPTTNKLMQAYCSIDPSALARQFRGPVLVMNGADDTQVSAQRDAPLLKKALQGRAKSKFDYLIVPASSHNFKSTATGDKDAIKGPILPQALAKIDSFLNKYLK